MILTHNKTAMLRIAVHCPRLAVTVMLGPESTGRNNCVCRLVQ